MSSERPYTFTGRPQMFSDVRETDDEGGGGGGGWDGCDDGVAAAGWDWYLAEPYVVDVDDDAADGSGMPLPAGAVASVGVFFFLLSPISGIVVAAGV